MVEGRLRAKIFSMEHKTNWLSAYEALPLYLKAPLEVALLENQQLVAGEAFAGVNNVSAKLGSDGAEFAELGGGEVFGLHGLHLGFAGDQLGPDFGPILAQLLAGDGAARCDLSQNAGLDGKSLVAISYVFKVSGGGFAALGERLTLGRWQGEKVIFEGHVCEITPSSVRLQHPFGEMRLIYSINE